MRVVLVDWSYFSSLFITFDTKMDIMVLRAPSVELSLLLVRMHEMVANVKTIFIAYSFWAGQDNHPVTAVVTGSIQFGFLQSQLKDRSMVYWLYVTLFCVCILCIHSPSVSLNNENNIIVISHNLNYFN